VPTIVFPGRPRQVQATGDYDEVIRHRPDLLGHLGAAIGAHVKWLAPALGGAPISSYEVAVREAMAANATAKNTVVSLSSYDDDELSTRVEGGAWTVVTSHITSEVRKEAEGHANKPSTYYEYYVPRLACGTDYVLAVRAYNTFHGYGGSRKASFQTPSCSPTKEPSFPPTLVSEMLP